MSRVLAERVTELRSMETHGGSWMARRAVETLSELAEDDAPGSHALFESLVEAARELAASRPGVASVAGASGRLLAAVHGQTHLPLDEFRRLVQAEAAGLVAARDRAARSIAIQLRPRLEDAFVLTHSASATVREALLYTPPAQVVCTVTAPHGEGRGLAQELADAGIDVELVPDAEAVQRVADASLLLFGADAVYQDGSLLNKRGTQALAEEATSVGVPTVIACEVIKLAPVDAPIDLSDELGSFDLTAPEHIDEIVTEEGAYLSDGLGELVARTPFLHEGYALLRA
jgi:translation initiation factor 2B subunit (eIF-2B alpha/beta/delta family)